MSPELEVQAIAVAVAVACAVPGTFLVLRRMAMLSDAISHAILLGIVLAFFVIRDLDSPWLVAAAAATGVLTVTLVELVHRTRLVREDAAIGLIFPLLFSLGVILISRYAGNIHLDTDAVLLGELAYAPFDRFELFGRDLGPRALWQMGGIALLNLAFVAAFFKELKLATFDAGLAAALGFAPAVVHYLLMTLVSVTAVGAFDAVGTVLVVALMVGPPAAAYLLTDRLPVMLALGCAIGAAAAVSGYWAAHWLDASIAGSMATAVGALFALALLAAPRRGLVAQALRRRRQRLEFAARLLLVHLSHHAETADAAEETGLDTLHRHLRWSPAFAAAVVRGAEARGWVRRQAGRAQLTAAGRAAAVEAVQGG